MRPKTLKYGLIAFMMLCIFFISSQSVFCEKKNGGEEISEQTIKKGDLLLIEVIGHEDLKREVTVDNEGNIPFPLIRKIRAQEKTIAQLAMDLEFELANYVKLPRVIIDYNEIFYVYGEVKRPGEYKLRGRINVIKAVIIAGGFTDFASHTIKVIKVSPKRRDIWVNVDRIIKGRGRYKETLIEPGDIIIVYASLL